MIEQDKKPFNIDLRLFGKDDEPVTPGYDSLDSAAMAMIAAEGGTPPVIDPAAPPIIGPVAPGAAPVAPAVVAEPAAAAPVAPEVDPMANPIIQQLIQQNQMLQTSMQQQSDIMQKFIQNSMTNNAPQPSPVVTKTPEEMEAEKEAFMEKFYANPMGVLTEHTDKAVKAATEPLQQKITASEDKEAWNDAIRGVATNTQSFPEFENVRQRMSDLIFKEKPYLLQSGDKVKALSDAYAIAMSEKAPVPQAAAPVQGNPADMMKNPDFIKQFMSNPEAMKMLMMEQAKQIQANSQQVPPMSPSSGLTNAAPFIQNKPNNYDEADALAGNMMKQGMA